MNRNILFICNTPYQLLMACNLSYTLLKECQVDVILSDHFHGAERMSEKINECNIIFRKAYFVKSFNFSRHQGEYLYLRKVSNRKLLYHINIKRIAESMIRLERNYNEFWVANYEEFTEVLFNYIRKEINHKIIINCYEDGYTSCCCDWWLRSPEMNAGFIRKIYEKYIKRITYSPKEFTGYYVMHPEDITFNIPYSTYKIPPINKFDITFMNQINELYEYNLCQDVYDKKVIFFEESYYVDGIPIDDLKYVEEVASIVGKENIMIKIHPRNSENRWEKMGYKTNKDMSIPWEIIALNQDFSNKILVSISCNSIITSYFLAGIKGKSLLLFDLCGLSAKTVGGGETMGVWFNFLLKMFTYKYQDTICIPHTKGEMKNILSRMFKNLDMKNIEE